MLTTGSIKVYAIVLITQTQNLMKIWFYTMTCWNHVFIDVAKNRNVRDARESVVA